MNSPVLGVIGGSGLYDIEGLEDVRERRVDTPYGAPSDVIVEGRLGATKLLFLPRHGRGHVHPPHLLNYRANVCAMKQLGATHLVSISAVGSMREHIVPGHLVVVDQFIDLTKRRASTFFDDGLVAHVALADPVCPLVSEAAAGAARRAGATVHDRGTYVCIEGPQFSTRAESNLYRSWGVDVIGMTAMPEAKLAREAELPYATVALATDYDCWHSSTEAVSVEAVIAVLRQNVALAKRVVRELAQTLPDPAKSPATGALASAVITSADHVDPAARERLAWLLDSNTKR
jgi:5'-methylthioadenosine phosphorylase